MSNNEPTPPTGPPKALPAGLELFYELEKSNVNTKTQAFIVCLHWALVRAGLRTIKGSPSTPSSSSEAPVSPNEGQGQTGGSGGGAAGSGGPAPPSQSQSTVETTERLLEGWARGTESLGPDGVTLSYINPTNRGERYQVRLIELSRDETLVVSIFHPDNNSSEDSEESSSSGPNGATTSAATTFQIGRYISLGEPNAGTGTRSANDIYKNAHELETKIWKELMEPLGLRVTGLPPILGPYANVSPEPEREQRRPIRPGPAYPLYDPFFMGPRVPLAPGGIGGPLHMPPLLPPFGGGLGRSDLDPFAGMGGGMIGDLRGMRGPRFGPVPPDVVPGGGRGTLPWARFDPVGPRGPNPPVPGRGGGPAFGNPDPDNEPRPPGFEDMFM